MIPEYKNLVIKDITARLSYNVKCKILETNETKILASINYDRENTLFDFWGDDRKIQYEYQLYLSEFKPYLFPLSSMTEKQKEIYCQLQQKVIYNSKGVVNKDVMEYVNWCYENHLDVNDLIPKGLAINATGLNIY